MKKKLLSIVALASLLVLGGCGDKTSSSTDATDTTKQTESSKASESAKASDTSKDSEPISDSTSDSSSESSDSSSDSTVVKTAAERHQDYLDNYANKNASVTIQGKVIHYVSYANSETCNIAIQEGKYGYWMNNVPQASIEVGKSYVFTGFGSGKNYPSLNMSKGTVTATDDIDAPVLTLGDENNGFADSQDAYMTIPAEGVVITSAETGKYGFKIGDSTYYMTYNTNVNVTQNDNIAAKIATLGVGCKVTKLTGIWYAEDTIQICDPDEIEFSIPSAESVTITAADDATEVQATGTLQLSAVVNPSAANQEVIWSTEKAEIATVDETGLVTGVSVGTTKIYATAKGTDVKGEFSLTVTDAPSVPVESIAITAEEGKTGADIGETVQLSTTVLPDNSLQTVTWTSSNDDIATVDASGLVTFVGDGDVTITAHASDESGVTGTINLSTVVSNLKTASEIGTIVKDLSNNTLTSEEYSFRAVVSAIKDEKNFIMRDSTGLIQGYSITASKLPEGMKAGDVVLVKAKFCKFNQLIEINDKGLTSIVISTKTIDGVSTTPVAKTKDEMSAFVSGSDFSAGEYVKIDNVKTFASGSYTNINIEGTELKMTPTCLNGLTIENDVWGTITGYLVTSNSIWVDSFTANANAVPTAVEVTGDTTVYAGKSISLKANVTASTTYANFDDSVTWSVANRDETVTDALATIDENGKLTAGETAGTVVVTATSVADTTVKGTLEVTIEVSDTPITTKSYALVKDATNLVEGDKIVIAYNNGASSYGLSTNAGKFYSSIAVNVSDETIEETENLVELTIGKGSEDNSFSFYDGTGYLAYTGTKNTMYQETEISVKTSFTLTIDSESGVTQAVSCKDSTFRIQYNTSSPRFACYNGSQKDISIFKLVTTA